MTFIDDYSSRCWVYTIEHKGEVLKLFVEWKNMKKSTGRKIKVFRSDNRGEYKSDPILKLCCDEDIKRHFTVKRNTATKLGSQKDEQDLTRKGPIYVIQYQIIKEFLG